MQPPNRRLGSVFLCFLPSGLINWQIDDALNQCSSKAALPHGTHYWIKIACSRLRPVLPAGLFHMTNGKKSCEI